MPSTHTVEASTFLWSQHDRPSVTTAEGTAEEFISKSTACRAVFRQGKSCVTIRGRGTANALRKQAHEAPGNHAFLPGWAQGQQSAASPVVVSSFLTDPIGCS
ncbi:hypothetical protein HN51_043395 [Arachis hypogaea]